MKRIRKYLKINIKYIIAFILGFLLTLGIGYAATIFFASDAVSYNNATSGLSSTNVQDALDELYVTAADVTSILQEIETAKSNMYPVGTIYISVTNTNPSSTFGGTWQAFGTGRTLVAVDSSQTEFSTVEKTGGHKEVQSHTHTFKADWKIRDTYNSAGSDAYRNASGSTNVSVAAGPSGFWSAGCTYQGNKSRGTWITINGTSSSYGSGNSGNLQPYITVYMWKRTA